MDVMVYYLALARFGTRPRLAALPRSLWADLRAFFGSYAEACRQADALLFAAGDAAAQGAAWARAPVGKLLPDDLYVHTSALGALEPLLRVYEGCGRAYLGELDGTRLIKIHRRSGKLSYLVYPDFETDPHPALARSLRLPQRTRQLDCYDYTTSANPPVLHRKETFLTPDHPLHARFARLSAQEDHHGLLTNSATIGTRDGWQQRLREAGFALRGHRLVRSAADPVEKRAVSATQPEQEAADSRDA